jgi:hypothetical protein
MIPRLAKDMLIKHLKKKTGCGAYRAKAGGQKHIGF